MNNVFHLLAFVSFERIIVQLCNGGVSVSLHCLRRWKVFAALKARLCLNNLVTSMCNTLIMLSSTLRSAFLDALLFSRCLQDGHVVIMNSGSLVNV